MTALGPALQLLVDQTVHFVEHPLGNLRRVVVRPAANLAIKKHHQVRSTALLMMANHICQIRQVSLLCRGTGSDDGFEAQRFAHGVLPRVSPTHWELAYRGTEEVKPCRLSSVGPEGMHDPRLARFQLQPHLCQPPDSYIARTLDVVQAFMQHNKVIRISHYQWAPANARSWFLQGERTLDAGFETMQRYIGEQG